MEKNRIKVIGIELGSTRIKAVLTDGKGNILAQGERDWENTLVDGLWSYSIDDAWSGLQESYANLAADYRVKFGEDLTCVDALGISGMMHGYLPFDKNGKQLAPFRTWRNTNAAKAAEELTVLFRFHVPMRWSVSQYYQSVLEGLDHVKKIYRLNTLAGYIHEKLSGKYVIGVNEASGMFPVDGKKYHPVMIEKFNNLLHSKGIECNFAECLPEILYAGENAGYLTEEGAKLLDPSGKLKSGIPMCPPEGDMGTGMIATNTISPHTANISAGTSGNLNVILDKPLKKYYSEIDIISTPDGYPAALIHTNNCTNEINEWVSLFMEAAELFGVKVSKKDAFIKLYEKSLESDINVGGVTAYNYLAGEPLAGIENGILSLFRASDGKMNIASIMQAQIYSAVSSLALGMDILYNEGVKIDIIYGHGGFYKEPSFVGMNATSAVLNAPVTVMKNAGEGGAWGIAILALYLLNNDKSLSDFLSTIFSNSEKLTVKATDAEKKKFSNYMERYRKLLTAEKAASDAL